MNKRYWHYTLSRNLPGIFGAGSIKVSTGGIESGIGKVAWFSTNTRWEETVRKSLHNKKTGEKTELLSRDGLSETGEPPIRIEIDPKAADLRSWNNYKKKSGDNQEVLKRFARMAKEWGADPSEWFVSYKDVPIDCFLSIEIWDGQKWVDLKNLSEAELIELQKPIQERSDA